MLSGYTYPIVAMLVNYRESAMVVNVSHRNGGD
jgi:hypothetical protein